MIKSTVEIIKNQINQTIDNYIYLEVKDINVYIEENKICFEACNIIRLIWDIEMKKKGLFLLGLILSCLTVAGFCGWNLYQEIIPRVQAENVYN